MPGGGKALLTVIPAVEDARAKARGDEKLGVDIVARALEIPMKLIASNAGADGPVIVAEVKEKEPHVGFDGNTAKFVDMFQAGIVDPAKVTRTALENAASIASVMLTTETLVTDIEEGKGKKPVEGSVH